MNLVIAQNTKHESARNFAYQVLLSNILQWNLYPGEIIKDNIISEQLGISRTPVREAMSSLRDDKLISVFSSSKSCVALIDSQLVYEGMYIRSTIESQIAMDICGKLTDLHKGIMRENLERQRYVAEGNLGLKSFFELDNEFHKMFYDISGKEFTYRMMKKSCYHLNRMRYYTYKNNFNDLMHIYKTHVNIFNCLVNNDSDQLKELMTRHVFDITYDGNMYLPKSLEKLSQSFPEYFSVKPELISDQLGSIKFDNDTDLRETLL